MRRSGILSAYSNRPASRRLHRCFPVNLPLRVHAAFAEARPIRFPQMSPVSSGDLAQDSCYVFDLLHARQRIEELERALEESSEAAFTDPLTGALNRRGFDRAYAREMARSRRNGSGLALAMIDFDDFKQLNDHYGHLAGDKALVHFVRVLQESMRPSDVLCRFGGEEFVLMMPGTVAEDACKAIRRFQDEFSSRSIPCVDMGCSTTFSAGVIEHDYFESLDEAIQRADAAAYAAKRAGKNRVMVG